MGDSIVLPPAEPLPRERVKSSVRLTANPANLANQVPGKSPCFPKSGLEVCGYFSCSDAGV